jgi:hypothetical protein
MHWGTSLVQLVQLVFPNGTVWKAWSRTLGGKREEDTPSICCEPLCEVRLK